MQETQSLVKEDWAAKFMAFAVVVLMVSSTLLLFTPDVSARTKTDSYGYTFVDNRGSDDGAPTYDWIEIGTNGVGTQIVGSTTDGGQGPYSLPFAFKMYDEEYTTWGNGGDNGYITFDGVISNAWTSARIPAGALGKAAIAGGWFDGRFCTNKDANAGVYHATIGDSPNRKFVVQYQDQGFYYTYCSNFYAGDTLTWQIILHEGSNEITMQYKDALGGGYGDNEYLAAGIQGQAGGTLEGLEYVYRRSPTSITAGTAVTFTPPPPTRNDLRLSSTTIPDPLSLDGYNTITAEVTNFGVNCDDGGSPPSTIGCTAQPETDISVNAQAFSVKDTKHTYTFDDDDGGFTSASIQGANKWTTNLDDGRGDNNYGDEGASDTSWSSGMKSSTLGAVFKDQNKLHYDGTSIVVADRGNSRIVKINPTTYQDSVIIGPDLTNLRNVVDITDDGTHYYTISKGSSLSMSSTWVCKWLMTDGSKVGDCNTSVRYGSAITHYDGELFALQTVSTTAYRKVVIINADDMTTNSKTITYTNGLSYSYYALGIDADPANGDIYLSFRHSSGLIRQYERQSDGTYGTGSSYYNQMYSYTYYPNGLDIHNGYVYLSGYYSSSFYGGMKKCPLGLGSSCTQLWSSYTPFGYKGSIGVVDENKIFVSSNYVYSHYSYSNSADTVWVHTGTGSAVKSIGPQPASLSTLTSPKFDASAAIGITLEFKISYNFYSRYGGAFLEISEDDGSTWEYVEHDHFRGGSGYYQYGVYSSYNQPLDTTKRAWTYYNTQGAYTRSPNDLKAPWKAQTVNLDDYSGKSDIRFRWVVGFNNYDRTYIDNFFRLDDVVVSLIEKDTTFKDETKTIASLDFEAKDTVEFFTGCSNPSYENKADCESNAAQWSFRPADHAYNLKVGDSVGIAITVTDSGGLDVNTDNNKIEVFREVKFVIFSDDFDDGVGIGEGWNRGAVTSGPGNTWQVRSSDSFGGSYSMDSGWRNTYGGGTDNYVSTDNLNLLLPVEAQLEVMISYYNYWRYDGYQVQISEEGGAPGSWSKLTPTSGSADTSLYSRYSIYNFAGYNNPLRGQSGYTYYGTTGGSSWSPDPQKWVKAIFDLNDYVGQDDIRIRMVSGWSTIPTYYGIYNSFMRMDNFAVTGLVYTNNVGLSGFNLPDPLSVGETVSVGTDVINAGLNTQTETHVQMKIGPLGQVSNSESDDFESYVDENGATAAGWSTSTECSDINNNACADWTSGHDGFYLRTDEGSGDETKSWGPSSGEFKMYQDGGLAEVRSPSMDFTDAPADLSLTLTHRYNFDIISGADPNSGGQVHISDDGGSTWDLLVPDDGYDGTINGGYASWGNPLWGQKGFTHCGSCPGSVVASDDEDEYITTEFDMSKYVDKTDVRIKFVLGMWGYQEPNDGEHWYIDSLDFHGTAMTSVVYEELVNIVGADGVKLDQAEKVAFSRDYQFLVPGEYKITFDAWIGNSPSDSDDFPSDNHLSAERSTMFEVVKATGDATTSDPEGSIMEYSDGWTSTRDGGAGHRWVPDSDSISPFWSIGEDKRGNSGDGDDTSLESGTFDLSKATSAKLVINHRFFFHYAAGTFSNTYYDGGRAEISTNSGTTWQALSPSEGELYAGSIYTSTYYGNPLRGQQAFAGESTGYPGLVETQFDLSDYTGDGFDEVMVRLHMGGSMLLNPSVWDVTKVAVYALGFDLKQVSASSPYSLDIGEGATFSTSFMNQGLGDLGSGGSVEAAYGFAYINDMEGTEVWSSSTALPDLKMSYYGAAVGENPKVAPQNLGEMTDVMTFDFAGKGNDGKNLKAGMYTAGVRVASDSSGTSLSDLFPSNNEASHMLIVGKAASLGSPAISGGDNWAAVADEPSEVGDGALSVSWDNRAIVTTKQDVSMGSGGFTPASASTASGATIIWTNNVGETARVVQKSGPGMDSPIDSMDLDNLEKFEETLTESGTYVFYNQYSELSGAEFTVTVVESALSDEQARTNYLKLWTPDAYLVFWAKTDMAAGDEITVKAQKKGTALSDSSTIGLWDDNGFTIMDGMDHTEVGDSVVGVSDWNPYYIHLDSKKWIEDGINYSPLAYNPLNDNAYAFVFQVSGIHGSASIGGVQVVRTLDNGFFMTKQDSKLTYEIFPSLTVDINYFVSNIGTEDNTFRFTPSLIAQGKDYKGEAFDISLQMTKNAADYSVTPTTDANGTSTYDLALSPDDEVIVTIRFGAPDFDQKLGEPAGNRKFNVQLNAVDMNNGEDMREPDRATLFIKPSQFVISDLSFDKVSVIEGDSVNITVKAWNEGNYASNVLVVFYVLDSKGTMYQTPDGNKRMVRVASTTVDLMAPKDVLSDQGDDTPWYFATGTWDETYIPRETSQDYDQVKMYAWINPPAEQIDTDAGNKQQDEYQNQQDDNDAAGAITVVKSKSSTPSFAIGIIGISIAALIVAVGTSLRRKD